MWRNSRIDCLNNKCFSVRKERESSILIAIELTMGKPPFANDFFDTIHYHEQDKYVNYLDVFGYNKNHQTVNWPTIFMFNKNNEFPFKNLFLTSGIIF
ncbi:hypothetical protein SB775_15765 [Peribacillus sp. SIMBA_075]|uniref:hypothetical protein n=1 Tax=Peribacillus sp. SIMBA_075 TaxID=3085813 RepID=UPI00397E3FE9